jgi:hypothetical protein
VKRVKQVNGVREVKGVKGVKGVLNNRIPPLHPDMVCMPVKERCQYFWAKRMVDNVFQNQKDETL